MRNSQKTEGSFQLLRPREVEKLLGVSETTVWRLSRTPGFPKKYQVSANAVAWREDDLLAWLETRVIEPLNDTERDVIEGRKS